MVFNFLEIKILEIFVSSFRLLSLMTAHLTYQPIVTDTLRSSIYIDLIPHSEERVGESVDFLLIAIFFSN